MIVRELVTRLGFTADETRVRRFGRAVDALKVGLVATTAAMGAASVAAFRLAGSTAQYGDELAKTADRLGITIDGLEQLRFAAERSGVAQQTLEMGLQRMTRRLSEAAQGSGEAKNAIAELGLDAEALSAMGPTQQLETLADALAGVENQSDRVRLAMRFFDSEGVRLLNLVGSGSEDVRALREEFERLSGGLTEKQARASEEYQDRLTDLQAAMQGLRLQIGSRLIPVMRPLLTSFTDFIVANREIISQRIATVFEGVSAAAANLMEVGQRLYNGALLPLMDWFKDLPAEAQVAVAGLTLLFSPFRSIWFLAAGALAILEDLGAWMRGSPSWIGELLGPYDDFIEKVNEIVDALGGWEMVAGALVVIRLAPWLFRVAKGVKSLAAATALLGTGAAAKGAGILGMLARRAGPIGLALGLAAPTALGDGTLSGRAEGMMDPNIPEGTPEWYQERDRIMRQIEERMNRPRTFEEESILDYLEPSSFGPRLDQIGGGRSTNNVTANVSMPITVPPGTTSDQIAFIERTVERTLTREINNAALALET